MKRIANCLALSVLALAGQPASAAQTDAAQRAGTRWETEKPFSPPGMLK